MSKDTVSQVAENTGALKTIETFGAGLVALLFIFIILFVLLKEGIPGLKALAASFIEAIDKMAETMTALDKTMVATQAASNAAMAALDKRIQAMELRLESHIETAVRIEGQVNTVCTTATEIKERVRSCGNQRELNTRTRKGDTL